MHVHSKVRRKVAAGAVAVGALVAAAVGLTFRAAPAGAVAGPYGVAPYVDLSANSANLLDTAITQTGLRAYTAAFVIGSGCTPIWGDSLGIENSTVNARIARAQSEGARTIIAFGGAGGAELAQSCTNTAALTAAYQAVINKYGVQYLDFDVEGAAIADPASINRRFQAIRTLEANNPGLNVSLTIPVLPSGPDGNGSAFLQAAKTNGVRIDLVNAMTMDYGTPVADMGAAAISAARGTLAAAQAVWPNFGWGNIGITPMIGQNDSAGEIFTPANARSVVSFANANGVGRLAFWSVGRDQPCPGGAGGGASPNCSSINQNALDFTRAFLSGSTDPGQPPTTGPTSPSPTATTTPPSTGQYPAWAANRGYTRGDRVSYAGHDYQCLQSHTSLTGWEPPNTPALWQAL